MPAPDDTERRRIVEQLDATIVIEPEQDVVVDELGNLIIDVRAS